jgi:hypothetical protein
VNDQRKRKLNLWKKDPHCVWCGEKTILHTHRQRKKLPWNMATVDHIITRNIPLRGKVKGRTVLSCNRCNFLRNRIEEKMKQFEEKDDNNQGQV